MPSNARGDEALHAGPFVVVQVFGGEVHRVIGPFITHAAATGWATDHQAALGFYVVAPAVRPALAVTDG